MKETISAKQGDRFCAFEAQNLSTCFPLPLLLLRYLYRHLSGHDYGYDACPNCTRAFRRFVESGDVSDKHGRRARRPWRGYSRRTWRGCKQHRRGSLCRRIRGAVAHSECRYIGAHLIIHYRRSRHIANKRGCRDHGQRYRRSPERTLYRSRVNNMSSHKTSSLAKNNVRVFA